MVYEQSGEYTQGGIMFPCEIKHEPRRLTLSIRFRSPVTELRQHFGEVYGAIGGYLQSQGVESAGPAFAVYYNMDMNDLDIEAGFVVPQPVPGRDKITAGEIPDGMFGVCHYIGPYSGVGDAYEQLTQFVAEQGYAPTGAAYEWYFDGPETPPEETRTDAAFPVMPISAKAPLPH